MITETVRGQTFGSGIQSRKARYGIRIRTCQAMVASESTNLVSDDPRLSPSKCHGTPCRRGLAAAARVADCLWGASSSQGAEPEGLRGNRPKPIVVLFVPTPRSSQDALHFAKALLVEQRDHLHAKGFLLLIPECRLAEGPQTLHKSPPTHSKK